MSSSNFNEAYGTDIIKEIYLIYQDITIFPGNVEPKTTVLIQLKTIEFKKEMKLDLVTMKTLHIEF